MPPAYSNSQVHPIDHKPKDWTADDFIPGSKLTDRLLAGEGVEAAHKAVRAVVPFLVKDRQVSIDIQKAEMIIRSGALIDAVEAATGVLN
ncbi:MAG: hypothetical protein IPP57_12725 [Candidatus Obscuribacter sp.]|nr:hypothetical protein [Candidatus Obscuribacter sp.]